MYLSASLYFSSPPFFLPGLCLDIAVDLMPTEPPRSISPAMPMAAGTTEAPIYVAITPALFLLPFPIVP
jgi:hypothetical protein